ncbi:MAG: tetratricopeptide repeat protein [Gammaproteobacteria bacterium]|nr:tetratricopeptide repeat protein [Gammaproteobacteria bacterium]
MSGKAEDCKDKYIWNREEPQPIAVPLPEYHAQHNTDVDSDDYGFIGREDLTKELIMVLNATERARGCYLISGYRGSGKTSLINRVLSLYNKTSKQPNWFPLNNSEKTTLKHLIREGKRKTYETVQHQADKQKLDWFCHKITGFFSTFRTRFRHFRRENFSFFPLVSVKVNLGYDQLLEPKEVLFNTTTLLYGALKRKRQWYAVAGYALLIVVLALFITLNSSLEAHPKESMFFGLGAWLQSLTGYKNFLTVTDQKWVFLAFGIVGFHYLRTRVLPSYSRVLHRLKNLNKRMASTLEINSGIKNRSFTFGTKETMPALDVRQIENELLEVLEDCRKIPWFFVKPNVVFIFDELDKISNHSSSNVKKAESQLSAERDLYERKQKVDSLLGALKNFITHGQARFFFIAGREMLDSYQAERGSTSSLYESLFNKTFEVPSLLTDSSDKNSHVMHSLLEVFVCRKLIDPKIAIYLWLQDTNNHSSDDPYWENDLYRKLQYSPFCLRTYYHYLCMLPDIKGVEARRIVLGLRNFIQFLTVHSWGNPKRVISLFEHFTKPVESVDWRQKENIKKISPLKKINLMLQFGLLDQQRILLASNLYTHLSHDLGRQLTNSGDKLTVSAMAAFQYILKFHRHPFSRYHLERMSEALNVYRSPELNVIIDTLVSKVLHSQIRRIRNSHYRYRFNGDFEQELRYISRISDIESAAFNFSLDASAPIKSHYLNQLNRLMQYGEEDETTGFRLFGKSEIGIYELCLILGDLYALEQSLDQAIVYYQRAVDIFENCTEEYFIKFAHLSVKALLRLGETYEQRQRYDQAANAYLRARSIVNKLGKSKRFEWENALKDGDSKWDVFRQPFWAYWFLQLKRSPVSSRGKLPPKSEYPFTKGIDDPVNHYRAGQLAFFYSCHYTAVGSFVKAIQCSGIEEANTEKTTYLGAYAYLHLGENIFSGMMRYLMVRDLQQTTTDLNGLKIQVNKFLKTILKTIKGMENISSLDDLEKAFSGNKNQYMRELKKIKSQTSFLDKVDVCKTLAMMVYAARLMSDRGLHYHASLAYMKVLSIWGMFAETLFSLTEIDGDNKARLNKGKPHQASSSVDSSSVDSSSVDSSSVDSVLRKSECWISEIRECAAENITDFSLEGYSRFHTRWKLQDVASPLKEGTKTTSDGHELSKFLTNEWVNNIKPIFEEQEKAKPDFDLDENIVSGFELKNMLNLLFPKIKNNEIRSYVKEKVESYVAEKIKGGSEVTREDRLKYKNEVINKCCFKQTINAPIFMQRSMMGQKLIYFAIWEYMSKIRFRTKRKPMTISHETMVPHSTRSLLFSHWLAGRRYLQWSILDKLPELTNPNEEEIKDLYDSVAAAIHNFHRSIYYMKQLTGNDQDLIFPDPSMIFYDLWQLLYALVKFEIKIREKTFEFAVNHVKKELSSSKLRNNNISTNYYDFHSMKRQATKHLRDIEHLNDITNRVRSDAIRTRDFLADDYEDPRFHLDWTLIQMYGPAAGVQRRYITLKSEQLKTGDDADRSGE